MNYVNTNYRDKSCPSGRCFLRLFQLLLRLQSRTPGASKVNSFQTGGFVMQPGKFTKKKGYSKGMQGIQHDRTCVNYYLLKTMSHFCHDRHDPLFHRFFAFAFGLHLFEFLRGMIQLSLPRENTPMSSGHFVGFHQKTPQDPHEEHVKRGTYLRWWRGTYLRWWSQYIYLKLFETIWNFYLFLLKLGFPLKAEPPAAARPPFGAPAPISWLAPSLSQRTQHVFFPCVTMFSSMFFPILTTRGLGFPGALRRLQGFLHGPHRWTERLLCIPGPVNGFSNRSRFILFKETVWKPVEMLLQRCQGEWQDLWFAVCIMGPKKCLT